MVGQRRLPPAALLEAGRVKVLVTGGVRSGKSRHAESLLAAAGAVAYVAP
ncbi:MAG: bifunctional adenosylcobinamide kinase/adenosylcobinamide-phosphate guanylyltransferase, partial [Nocardioides sp.]